MMPSILSIDKAWLIEMIDKRLAEHGLIKEQPCKHNEIVSGAYPRSNPPALCEKCREYYR